MNLHEYQAKKLFAEYGIPVPPGKIAHSVKEALRNAAHGKYSWRIKIIKIKPHGDLYMFTPIN